MEASNFGLPCRRQRTARGGYVLLATVAVLVLGVVVLAGAMRRSLSRIVLANAAQDELQLKWGAVSCRQAMLPHAKQIMEARDAAAGGPASSVRGQVRLGKYRYTLVVGDEAAKANVNAMLRSGRHRWEVEQAIREALRGSGVGNHVRLAVPPEGNPAPVGSFVQVFHDLNPAALLEQKPGAIAPADVLTCWSDGKVNVLRAGEPALQAALAPKFGGVQISELIRMRAKLVERKGLGEGKGASAAASRPAEAPMDLTTPAGRSQALAGIVAALPAKAEGAGVQELLTGSSSCFSVWIVAEDGKVQKSELTVMEAADPRHPTYWSFAW